jgi:hypothetical protein
MAIRIRDSADPLSAQALSGGREVIVARSEAGRLLRQELIRYCSGEIQGRSFLIAGHRGAGKTTMVLDALSQILISNPSAPSALRPLPIFLHGPSLLETLPSDLRRDDISFADVEPAADGQDGRVTPASQNQAVGRHTPEDEKQAQLALVHLILSLHRAVVREFAQAYRGRLERLSKRLPEHDLGELAAQFEIELLEDPPASRLREFWRLAEGLTEGILFDGPRPWDQGTRELVAINGICNAHQRISGALSQKEVLHDNQSKDREVRSGMDVKGADLLKSLGVVYAGATVAAGAAVASSLEQGGLFGLLAAFMSAVFLKRTVTTTSKRSRNLDRTFLPDLTPRTLDRALPMLLDRLRSAGLAPVLVIDELDKVDDLASRIENMIRYFKKLMAENVFSCFLTDRSYIEHLRASRDVAYDRASSYFSHRLMVGYGPKEVDGYLTRLLDVDPGADDDLDNAVLKWVLRHRSQLHALSLNRELAALRGDDGNISIPAGELRTAQQYRIDVTLQMAIELQLHSTEIAGWLQRQPSMQQTLFDALYYFSRSWLHGDRKVDLSAQGKKAIIEGLEHRMNLDEACAKKIQAGQTGQQRGSASTPLSEDDISMLTRVLDGMVRFLSPNQTRAGVDHAWQEIGKQLRWRQDELPAPPVMDALLLEEKSLLNPMESTSGDAHLAHIYEWRYQRSAQPRNQHSDRLLASASIRQHAEQQMEYIRAVESSLLSVLADASNPSDSHVFHLLGERCRVLGTTPAWPQVCRAVVNLTLLGTGAGNSETIEADCQVIEDFAKLLREGEQAILDVVLSAAVLCGVSEAGPRLSMADCVSLLSAGLVFARLDALGVRDKARAFWDKLRSVQGEGSEGQRVGLTGETLAFAVERLIQKGRDWRVNWDEQRQLAWKSLEQRLSTQDAAGAPQFATLPEILCAARQTGPSPVPGLDLERIPLGAWAPILLTMMPLKPVEAKVTFPKWLLAVALRRLGVHTLPSAMAEHLFRGFGLREYLVDVTQTSARSSNGKIAIVVRRAGASLTDSWISAPAQGMVIVVSLEQLNQSNLIEGLKAMVPAHQMVLVWEEPVDDSHLQTEAMSRIADSLDALYMYHRGPATKEPSVIDPSGPDALFRRAHLKRRRAAS